MNIASHREGVSLRPSAQSHLTLKPTEERCLRLLHQHHYLTTEHLCRALGLSAGSASYVRALVASLVRLGLCERIDRDRPGPHGSMAGVYTLTTRGRRLLTRSGIATDGRSRPSEERNRSRVFLSHTLACANVAISLSLLSEQTSEISVQRLWQEQSLRRQPAYVQLEGKRRAVIPDLVVDLDVDGYQVMLSCEVDLTSERGPAWKRKIAGLAAWARGPYRDAFQTDSLTIAVIAPGDERRAATLCRWTQDELVALDSEQLGSLFVFSGRDPASIPPREFWLGATGFQPFTSRRIPLVEGGVP